MKKINIFDTTLRDGQQSPGSAFGLEKRIDVGIKGNSIVIGKHSGRHGVKHILSEAGVSITEDQLDVLMGKIKLLEDGKHLSSNELVELL